MIEIRNTEDSLDRESILKRITEYDIFHYYAGSNFRVNGTFSSPLREDDANASFGVFQSTNGLRFKDFKTGRHGDCFQFVMDKFSYTFNEALRVIDTDFGLKLSNTVVFKAFTKEMLAPSNLTYTEIVRPRKYDIRVRYRNWNWKDTRFWDQYGISRTTCEYFKVAPIDYYWIENTRYKCMEIAYVIHVGSRMKIYQPLATKDSSFEKWYGNCNMNSIHGYEIIPEKGEILIITSSNKEAMYLAENLKLPSVAPNAEGVVMAEHLVDILKKRYKRLVIFFRSLSIRLSGTKRC